MPAGGTAGRTGRRTDGPRARRGKEAWGACGGRLETDGQQIARGIVGKPGQDRRGKAGNGSKIQLSAREPGVEEPMLLFASVPHSCKVRLLIKDILVCFGWWGPPLRGREERTWRREPPPTALCRRNRPVFSPPSGWRSDAHVHGPNQTESRSGSVSHHVLYLPRRS